MNKATDTSLEVGTFGRVHKYWLVREVKNTKGDIIGGRELPDVFAMNLNKVLEQWHLRAFEFGNWETQSDRWENVRACIKSLEDLKRIIKTDNIGFDRHIAIAFGARGMGGKTLAHYEPAFNDINITKPHNGCLAHEYGHALDYNFGGYIDQHKKYTALSGGHLLEEDKQNTGGELRYLINKILIYVRSTVSYQFAWDNDYHSRATEIFARFFEQYISYRLDKLNITNRYLTRSLAWYYKYAKAGYLTKEELQPILPVADKLIACLSDFFNGKRSSVGNFDYPESPKRAVIKVMSDKNSHLFGSLSNVISIKNDDTSIPVKPVGDAYCITQHWFTDDEKRSLGYLSLPERIKKRGWLWQVDFRERGKLNYLRIGAIQMMIERMPQTTFVCYYKQAKKVAKENKSTGVTLSTSKTKKAAASVNKSGSGKKTVKKTKR